MINCYSKLFRKFSLGASLVIAGSLYGSAPLPLDDMGFDEDALALGSSSAALAPAAFHSTCIEGALSGEYFGTEFRQDNQGRGFKLTAVIVDGYKTLVVEKAISHDAPEYTKRKAMASNELRQVPRNLTNYMRPDYEQMLGFLKTSYYESNDLQCGTSLITTGQMQEDFLKLLDIIKSKRFSVEDAKTAKVRAVYASIPKLQKVFLTLIQKESFRPIVAMLSELENHIAESNELLSEFIEVTGISTAVEFGQMEYRLEKNSKLFSAASVFSEFSDLTELATNFYQLEFALFLLSKEDTITKLFETTEINNFFQSLLPFVDGGALNSNWVQLNSIREKYLAFVGKFAVVEKVGPALLADIEILHECIKKLTIALELIVSSSVQLSDFMESDYALSKPFSSKVRTLEAGRQSASRGLALADASFAAAPSTDLALLASGGASSEEVTTLALSTLSRLDHQDRRAKAGLELTGLVVQRGEDGISDIDNYLMGVDKFLRANSGAGLYLTGK